MYIIWIIRHNVVKLLESLFWPDPRDLLEMTHISSSAGWTVGRHISNGTMWKAAAVDVLARRGDQCRERSIDPNAELHCRQAEEQKRRALGTKADFKWTKKQASDIIWGSRQRQIQEHRRDTQTELRANWEDMKNTGKDTGMERMAPTTLEKMK